MNVPMKKSAPTATQMAFRKAMEAAVRDHAASLDAMEILAVMSHMVGQVVALQDQRVVTPEMAMAIVGRNMETGNAEVVDGLLNAIPGGTA